MDLSKATCWQCNENSSSILCDQCDTAAYCNRTCRLQDWNRHQYECQNIREQTTCAQCLRIETRVYCKRCCWTRYCSRECRKIHQLQHSASCSSHRELSLAMTISLHRFLLSASDRKSVPPYIGTRMANDYIQLSDREGLNWQRPLKVLFAGLGDWKDVVETVASLPEACKAPLHFVLQGESLHAMAKLVLLLYVSLSSVQDLCPKEVLQVWYSVTLTQENQNHLSNCLKGLLFRSKEEVLLLMGNKLTISDDNWNKCKLVWQGWLQLLNDPGNSARILQQCKELAAVHFKEWTNYIKSSIPVDHIPSYSLWADQQLFLHLKSSDRPIANKINVTLTCYNPFNLKVSLLVADVNAASSHFTPIKGLIKDTDNMVYGVHWKANPFVCWDYLKVIRSGMHSDVAELYWSYVHSKLSTFITTVKLKAITFQVVIDDFRRLECHVDHATKFDRIGTGNMSDIMSSPVVLEMVAPWLNKANKCALIITQHVNWFYETGLYKQFPLVDDNGQFITDGRHSTGPVDIEESLVHGAYDGVLDDNLSIWCPFYRYLQAEIMVYKLNRMGGTPTASTIRRVDRFMEKRFEVKLLDFNTDFNSLIPFRFRVHNRRVSIYRGDLITLQWSPIFHTCTVEWPVMPKLIPEAIRFEKVAQEMAETLKCKLLVRVKDCDMRLASTSGESTDADAYSIAESIEKEQDVKTLEQTSSKTLCRTLSEEICAKAVESLQSKNRDESKIDKIVGTDGSVADKTEVATFVDSKKRKRRTKEKSRSPTANSQGARYTSEDSTAETTPIKCENLSIVYDKVAEQEPMSLVTYEETSEDDLIFKKFKPLGVIVSQKCGSSNVDLRNSDESFIDCAMIGRSDMVIEEQSLVLTCSEKCQTNCSKVEIAAMPCKVTVKSSSGKMAGTIALDEAYIHPLQLSPTDIPNVDVQDAITDISKLANDELSNCLAANVDLKENEEIAKISAALVTIKKHVADGKLETRSKSESDNAGNGCADYGRVLSMTTVQNTVVQPPESEIIENAAKLSEVDCAQTKLSIDDCKVKINAFKDIAQVHTQVKAKSLELGKTNIELAFAGHPQKRTLGTCLTNLATELNPPTPDNEASATLQVSCNNLVYDRQMSGIVTMKSDSMSLLQKQETQHKFNKIECTSKPDDQDLFGEASEFPVELAIKVNKTMINSQLAMEATAADETSLPAKESLLISNLIKKNIARDETKLSVEVKKLATGNITKETALTVELAELWVCNEVIEEKIAVDETTLPAKEEKLLIGSIIQENVGAQGTSLTTQTLSSNEVKENIAADKMSLPAKEEKLIVITKEKLPVQQELVICSEVIKENIAVDETTLPAKNEAILIGNPEENVGACDMLLHVEEVAHSAGNIIKNNVAAHETSLVKEEETLIGNIKETSLIVQQEDYVVCDKVVEENIAVYETSVPAMDEALLIGNLTADNSGVDDTVLSTKGKKLKICSVIETIAIDEYLFAKEEELLVGNFTGEVGGQGTLPLHELVCNEITEENTATDKILLPSKEEKIPISVTEESLHVQEKLPAVHQLVVCNKEIEEKIAVETSLPVMEEERLIESVIDKISLPVQQEELLSCNKVIKENVTVDDTSIQAMDELLIGNLAAENIGIDDSTLSAKGKKLVNCSVIEKNITADETLFAKEEVLLVGNVTEEKVGEQGTSTVKELVCNEIIVENTATIKILLPSKEEKLSIGITEESLHIQKTLSVQHVDCYKETEKNIAIGEASLLSKEERIVVSNTEDNIAANETSLSTKREELVNRNIEIVDESSLFVKKEEHLTANIIEENVGAQDCLLTVRELVCTEVIEENTAACKTFLPAKEELLIGIVEEMSLPVKQYLVVYNKVEENTIYDTSLPAKEETVIGKNEENVVADETSLFAEPVKLNCNVTEETSLSVQQEENVVADETSLFAEPVELNCNVTEETSLSVQQEENVVADETSLFAEPVKLNCNVTEETSLSVQQEENVVADETSLFAEPVELNCNVTEETSLSVQQEENVVADETSLFAEPVELNCNVTEETSLSVQQEENVVADETSLFAEPVELNCNVTEETSLSVQQEENVVADETSLFAEPVELNCNVTEETSLSVQQEENVVADETSLLAEPVELNCNVTEETSLSVQQEENVVADETSLFAEPVELNCNVTEETSLSVQQEENVVADETSLLAEPVKLNCNVTEETSLSVQQEENVVADETSLFAEPVELNCNVTEETSLYVQQEENVVADETSLFAEPVKLNYNVTEETSLSVQQEEIAVCIVNEENIAVNDNSLPAKEEVLLISKIIEDNIAAHPDSLIAQELVCGESIKKNSAADKIALLAKEEELLISIVEKTLPVQQDHVAYNKVIEENSVVDRKEEEFVFSSTEETIVTDKTSLFPEQVEIVAGNISEEASLPALQKVLVVSSTAIEENITDEISRPAKELINNIVEKNVAAHHTLSAQDLVCNDILEENTAMDKILLPTKEEVLPIDISEEMSLPVQLQELVGYNEAIKENITVAETALPAKEEIVNGINEQNVAVSEIMFFPERVNMVTNVWEANISDQTSWHAHEVEFLTSNMNEEKSLPIQEKLLVYKVKEEDTALDNTSLPANKDIPIGNTQEKIVAYETELHAEGVELRPGNIIKENIVADEILYLAKEEEPFVDNIMEETSLPFQLDELMIFKNVIEDIVAHNNSLTVKEQELVTNIAEDESIATDETALLAGRELVFNNDVTKKIAADELLLCAEVVSNVNEDAAFLAPETSLLVHKEELVVCNRFIENLGAYEISLHAEGVELGIGNICEGNSAENETLLMEVVQLAAKDVIEETSLPGRKAIEDNIARDNTSLLAQEDKLVTNLIFNETISAVEDSVHVQEDHVFSRQIIEEDVTADSSPDQKQHVANNLVIESNSFDLSACTNVAVTILGNHIMEEHNTEKNLACAKEFKCINEENVLTDQTSLPLRQVVMTSNQIPEQKVYLDEPLLSACEELVISKVKENVGEMVVCAHIEESASVNLRTEVSVASKTSLHMQKELVFDTQTTEKNFNLNELVRRGKVGVLDDGNCSNEENIMADEPLVYAHEDTLVTSNRANEKKEADKHSVPVQENPMVGRVCDNIAYEQSEHVHKNSFVSDSQVNKENDAAENTSLFIQIDLMVGNQSTKHNIQTTEPILPSPEYLVDDKIIEDKADKSPLCVRKELVVDGYIAKENVNLDMPRLHSLEGKLQVGNRSEENIAADELQVNDHNNASALSRQNGEDEVLKLVQEDLFDNQNTDEHIHMHRSLVITRDELTSDTSIEEATAVDELSVHTHGAELIVKSESKSESKGESLVHEELKDSLVIGLVAETKSGLQCFHTVAESPSFETKISEAAPIVCAQGDFLSLQEDVEDGVKSNLVAEWVTLHSADRCKVSDEVIFKDADRVIQEDMAKAEPEMGTKEKRRMSYTWQKDSSSHGRSDASRNIPTSAKAPMRLKVHPSKPLKATNLLDKKLGTTELSPVIATKKTQKCVEQEKISKASSGKSQISVVTKSLVKLKSAVTSPTSVLGTIKSLTERVKSTSESKSGKFTPKSALRSTPRSTPGTPKLSGVRPKTTLASSTVGSQSAPRSSSVPIRTVSSTSATRQTSASTAARRALLPSGKIGTFSTRPSRSNTVTPVKDVDARDSADEIQAGTSQATKSKVPKSTKQMQL